MIIKINNYQIPKPATMDYSLVYGTGSDSSPKVNLVMRWNDISSWDNIKILKLISNPTFTLEYPDPKEGNNSTSIFHVEKCDTSIIPYEGNTNKWEYLEIEFLEGERTPTSNDGISDEILDKIDEIIRQEVADIIEELSGDLVKELSEKFATVDYVDDLFKDLEDQIDNAISNIDTIDGNLQ